MRKLFYSMLAAVTLLASCQKDADLEAMETADGMVDVTVSATMEGTSATTRAIAEYGTGAKVDRCIMEVYIGDVLYKRMVAVPDALSNDTRDVTFELRLVADQTYDFLFWADASKGFSGTSESYDHFDYDGNNSSTDYDNYYDTNKGLKAITASYANYVGSDETRDAFFGNKLGVKIESSVVLNEIYLKRPFGQLNVSTGLTDVPTDMYPKAVKIVYSTTVGDTFDVSDGTVGGTDTKIVWDVKGSIETSFATGSTLMHLSTDYLFASDTEQDLHNFDMTFYSDDAGKNEINTNDNFKNIPIQRNYRTNVTGELLTKQGTINVTIVPTFENDDIDQTIYEVATIAEAEAILAAASEESVYIKITEYINGDAYLNLDTTEDFDSSNAATSIATTVENITLDFANVTTDAKIYIGKDLTSGSNSNTSSTNESAYAEDLNIILSSENVTIANLTVYTPLAHVEYVEGSAVTATVFSSNSTFVIHEATSIGTLTLDGGNVDIHGTVGDSVSSTNKGIIISATNTTTTSIDVYDGGTLYNANPADNSSFSQTITITTYDSGEVKAADSSFTIAAAVSDFNQLKAMLVDDAINSITLSSDITITEELTITKPITLEGDLTVDGNSNLLTMSGAGHFVVKGDVTMNNMSIASTTTIRTGTIYVEDAYSTLAINDSTIDYNTTGDSSALNNGIIVVNPASGVDYVDVTITNSTLNLNSTYQAGVSFMPTVQQYGSSLTLDNTLIHATQGSETVNASHTTGLSLGKVDGFKFDMKNGSEIRYVYYGYYGYEWYHPTNIDIDITDSKISGYGIMFRGEGGAFDIKNSTIIGRNFYDGSSSGFATITFTYDDYDGNVTAYNPTKNIAMTIDNSTIKAYRANTCTQYVIDVRSSSNEGNTINIINDSELIEEVAVDVDYALIYLISIDDGDTVVTTDGTEILAGSTNVRLLLAITLAGEGTSDNPYEIYKPYEMTGDIGESGKYYKLMNDIDMSETSYIPGTQNQNSEFDGNNCTISNLHVTSTAYPAGLLFNYCKGTVKDLTIENSSIKGNEYNSPTITGGLVGYLSGTIQDCKNSVTVSAYSTPSGKAYLGGYAGYVWGGTIKNCEFSGEVKPREDQNGTTYAAGFAGYFRSSSNTLTNCEFTGSVSGDSANAFYCVNSSYTYTLTESGNTSSGTVNGDAVIIPAE